MGIPSDYEKYLSSNKLSTENKKREEDKRLEKNMPAEPVEKKVKISNRKKRRGRRLTFSGQNDTSIDIPIYEQSESEPHADDNVFENKTEFSALDHFLTLLDLVGAIVLIACIAIGFYFEITALDPVSNDIEINTRVVSISKTGEKCIDGFMYDAFTMEVSGDELFYAPEGSIKWDKNNNSKKRCAVYAMTTETKFSYTESPFVFAKMKEKIGGTENFGKDLKSGDVISVSTREVGNDLLLNTYETSVQLIQYRYSFEQNNNFSNEEIKRSKKLVIQLSKKKRENIRKIIDDILPYHINNSES